VISVESASRIVIAELNKHNDGTMQKFPYSVLKPVDDYDRSIEDAIARIKTLNESLRQFWSQANGWAPEDAATLMSKSRLDWQVSLSKSLSHWICDPVEGIPDGDLILGWANLGSLIEGTLKLFLAVFYEDYKQDLETLKKTQAWHKKNQVLLAPDSLALDTLIDYVAKASLFTADEIELCKLVQSRRNAIHAFKDRQIGTGPELHLAIKKYLTMLRATAHALPYPNDSYIPREA
jgi:hypothetical protein